MNEEQINNDDFCDDEKHEDDSGHQTFPLYSLTKKNLPREKHEIVESYFGGKWQRVFRSQKEKRGKAIYVSRDEKENKKLSKILGGYRQEQKKFRF